MKLNIKGSYNLDQLLRSDRRFISMVGGSRSGKTYAILQWIIIYCLKNRDKTVSIARKTFPALRAGAYREFIQLLKDLDIYVVDDHNKTNNTYTLHDCLIQFISVDQSIKLRGLAHDVVFVDEVNELSKEEFDQLAMRTAEKILMASNPSDSLHFSLNYQNNPDATYVHSTYKDNPFLPTGIINQIESYKDTDEDMWNIYGLGLPAKNNELVYNHHKFYDDEELYVKDADGKMIPIFSETIYGLDFGFNHPTALIQVRLTDRSIYCEEIIHESYLTTSDLIQKMISLNVPKDKTIYCDSAEPKTIEEIKRAGFDAVLSMKEVKEGIDCIKGLNFYINNNSTKLISELRKYKWKMKGEQKTDEPIRLFDDGLCAIRYATYTYLTKTKRSNDYDFDIEIIDL